MTSTWLIWFEENPSAAPEATLRAAIQRYTEKFGAAPNRALVPLSWPEIQPNGIAIERSRYILPRHVHLALDASLEKLLTLREPWNKITQEIASPPAVVRNDSLIK